uniref:Uncharacterized protein n=1 Tax=Candidatus Kentrum sp. LPFa TaxID=2126335 RepID=A0A450XAF3_9GAMM|nr:MAG: hypothetical protein BECKLPF1236A_GA0070988_1002918 [Candidatus Kentron sp. LPFa]VFK26180.1 MAG: hypothetical protein BECKLPF1236C_GA0070990_1003118 [Candidatus Kentron sp. LPFa]
MQCATLVCGARMRHHFQCLQRIENEGIEKSCFFDSVGKKPGMDFFTLLSIPIPIHGGR